MTTSEIQAAIERLQAMVKPDGYCGNISDVICEFMEGTVSGKLLLDMLINLLRQADPDTHITLPVGADGGVIRIGDMVEHCYNGRWGEPFEVAEMRLRPSGWMVSGENGAAVIVETCRHYHEPTIKDVLRDFLSAAEDAMRKGYSEVPDEVYTEYANKLKEMQA